MIAKNPNFAEDRRISGQMKNLKKLVKKTEKEFALKNIKNLNEEAQAQRIDPLIGREEEIERCIQVL